ncbi:MAG: hypothetical protein M1829_000531 [Trizodia sp. TS-e1964]|nr:MAG: hypothetical protein M1829_000531 [Trizodia sp. TS-e1964]
MFFPTSISSSYILLSLLPILASTLPTTQPPTPQQSTNRCLPGRLLVLNRSGAQAGYIGRSGKFVSSRNSASLFKANLIDGTFEITKLPRSKPQETCFLNMPTRTFGFLECGDAQARTARELEQPSILALRNGKLWNTQMDHGYFERYYEMGLLWSTPDGQYEIACENYSGGEGAGFGVSLAWPTLKAGMQTDSLAE